MLRLAAALMLFWQKPLGGAAIGKLILSIQLYRVRTSSPRRNRPSFHISTHLWAPTPVSLDDFLFLYSEDTQCDFKSTGHTIDSRARDAALSRIGGRHGATVGGPSGPKYAQEDTVINEDMVFIGCKGSPRYKTPFSKGEGVGGGEPGHISSRS